METPVAVRFTRFGKDGLRALVTGSRSLAGTIEYWEAIARCAGENRPSKLLVLDELVGTELSAAEWEQLVENMLGFGLRSLRIAHVKPAGLGQAEYCEIYANIAGFDARAFTDEAQAMRWLRYGSEPDGGAPVPFGTGVGDLHQ